LHAKGGPTNDPDRWTTVEVMETGWTAPPVERPQPDLVAAERASLEQWLDYHRATLLGKCAGLTTDQLKRRAVPPSTLSLLGLVRHMTDVERWWLRQHVAGEDLPDVYATEQNEDADFEDVQDADAAADLETYRREVDMARAAAATRSLDDVVPSRGHHPERVRSVRWILVHLVEEYARHNGHADLLRECIDGSTGM
jgi:uncharacterized damage-inducible protein DinB